MKLSPRDRRAILLGALAAAAVLVYALAVRPLLSRTAELKERREMLVESLARYGSVVAAQSAYEVASDTARARLLRLVPRTFSGGSPEEATAALLGLVNEAATSNFVRVVRSVPLTSDSVAAGVVSVGARVECESDLAGALGLLRSLETAGRLVHVSELRISGRSSGPAIEGAQALSIELTVKGFLIASPTEDSDASRGDSYDPIVVAH